MPRNEPAHQRAAADAAHTPSASPAHATDPDSAARRERAALLRAFDSSPLTKANFCALKRMPPAELDVQLARARKEAADRPQLPPTDRAFQRPGLQPDQGPRGPRPQRR